MARSTLGGRPGPGPPSDLKEEPALPASGFQASELLDHEMVSSIALGTPICGHLSQKPQET